ncbi:protein MAIN-LIKE 2-like [Lycium barbarum]|uniref:protein MAIN-LIKE 2-like n=1 Tax=Lycium barbarum TaxID=112863 RepID=UPI00293EB038|nr:protein MAIN-LIKE 2-like [Lycium barbarum]
MDHPTVTVHPGPENYDVLILQQQHRSQVVWDGNLTGQDACLTIRRANYEFWNHVRQHPLHNGILNYFERCGFRGVLEVRDMQYDEGIITALIERWHQETHTFHMRTDKCTITLWQQLMYELTGWSPEEESIKSSSLLKIKALSKHVETLNDNDEHTDEIVVQQRVRLYLLWLFGGTIFPDNTGALPSLDFLDDISDLDAMGGKAWGAAALSSLYNSLCRASMCNSV